MTRVSAWALAAALFAGCGGAPSPSTPPGSDHQGAEPTVPAGEPAAAADDQPTRGGKLYAGMCAGCHGDHGEGAGKASALVGKTALPLDPPSGSGRKVQFETAADVIAYVKANMPPKKAGTLTDDEASAIVAFALKANGVDTAGKTIDPAGAAAIVLHP